MKKLFKKEWKFYTTAIVLITLVMIGYNFWEEEIWYSYEAIPYELSVFIPFVLNKVCLRNTANIVIIAIAYVVIKCCYYWNERNSYGRDFKLTIPVKERVVEGFYLLADMALVMLPVVLYRSGQCLVAVSELKKYHVEIPWLWSAMFPFLLKDIAYLFMLLAVFRLLEGLIVNGVWKVAGAAVAIALFLAGLCMAGYVFPKEEYLSEISDFAVDFLLPDDEYSYVEIDINNWEKWENAENELIDKISDLRGKNENIELEQLYNGEMSPDLEVLYNGKPIEDSFYSIVEESCKEWGTEENDSNEIASQTAFEWMRYDFEMQEFACYKKVPDAESIWGYLGMTAAMCILTLWLAGKRDASKSIFYFDFVKYMYGLLCGSVVLFVGLATSIFLWHRILIIIVAVCTVLICIYWMTPKECIPFEINGKKREKNKKYKVEKSC